MGYEVGKSLRADDIKADFENLKTRWNQMLRKYFVSEQTLDTKYTIETSCPHCNSIKIVASFLLNGFWHKICESCKIVYVSPRLKNEFIEELYADEYYSEMYARSMLPLFDKRKELIGKSKYSQSIHHWGGTSPGRVLDIGGGIGEVIDVYRENKWQTHVTEMNLVAIDWLKKRGFTEVFHGSLDAYDPTNEFDIIMAWGVVEHVINPDVFLQKVVSMLKPGGVFISEVPHGQSLLIDYSRKTGLDPKRILMGEQHIVLYSIQAYTDLHERNGLDKIHLQTNGLDVSTIFKESGVNISDEMLTPLQESVDEKMYGDLLRGFWRKP